MANLVIPGKTENKRWYHIIVKDDAGNPEPIDPGTSFTSVTNDPAKLETAAGPHPQDQQPAVYVRALVDEAPPGDGLTLTVDDVGNLRSYTTGVEISDVTPATQVEIDTTNFYDEPVSEPPAAA